MAAVQDVDVEPSAVVSFLRARRTAQPPGARPPRPVPPRATLAAAGALTRMPAHWQQWRRVGVGLGP